VELYKSKEAKKLVAEVGRSLLSSSGPYLHLRVLLHLLLLLLPLLPLLHLPPGEDGAGPAGAAELCEGPIARPCVGSRPWAPPPTLHFLLLMSCHVLFCFVLHPM
jgi:hypothetical protein